MNAALTSDYRLVIKSIKDYGIFMLDVNGYIQSWNEGAQRIKQYTQEEIIGNHFSIFYTPEEKAAKKPERELEIAKVEGKYEEEGWRVKKDGSLFWANIIITTVYDEENKLVGFSKVTRDLTEKKKNAEILLQSNKDLKEVTRELTVTNNQLAQANIQLEEFASIVSHDLKEPLRKITTFAGMIADRDTNLSELSANLLGKIRNAASRMNVMIEDILALSILSHKQEKSLVNLETIMAEVKSLLEQTIEDKKAIITTDKLPEVRLMRVQIVQLFQNLISNSLKFAHDGVPPRISITHRFLKREEIGAEIIYQANDYLELVFSDNGIGFEEDAAEAIFGLFTRLHGRTKYEGTGLGLGICKRVVENHLGTIKATSKPGKGATFTILFPLGVE